jgi:hypothetical protein
MQIIKCCSVLSRLSSIIVLALAVFSGSVFAQKADRPEVKVGDQWVFEDLIGASEVKAAVNTRVITYVTPAGIEGTENGRKLVLTPDLNVVESHGYTYTDLRRLNFPLEVGKTWSFTDDAALGTGKFHRSCTGAVVSYEKVRVPAGEFDAFKLETKCNSLPAGATGTPDVLTWKDWYAATARSIVKSQFVWGADPTTMTTQLTEYKLQP